MNSKRPLRVHWLRRLEAKLALLSVGWAGVVAGAIVTGQRWIGAPAFVMVLLSLYVGRRYDRRLERLRSAHGPLGVLRSDEIDQLEHMLTARAWELQQLKAKLEDQEAERQKFDASNQELVRRFGATLTQIGEIVQSQEQFSRQFGTSVAALLRISSELKVKAQTNLAQARLLVDAVENSREVTKACRSAFNRSVVQLEDGQRQTQNLINTVQVLATRSQSLNEVTVAIRKIADQINLVALNASIEASRAGESGRGFTIVAGEVKALATQSKIATAKIRQMLEEIGRMAETTVHSTPAETNDLARNALHWVSELSGTVNDFVATTNDSAEKIREAADQEIAVLYSMRDTFAQLGEAAAGGKMLTEKSRHALSELKAIENDMSRLAGASEVRS